MLLSKQEMFNKAYNGVVKQGHKSATTFGKCLYLCDDGSMCAVGHIMDGIVSKDSGLWQTKGDVEDLQNLSVNLGEQLPWDSAVESFLINMQYAHDYSNDTDFISNFKKQMKVVARNHGLSVPETV